MTMTIPTDSSELQDFLGDNAKMSEVMKDKGAFTELIQNYAKSWANKNVDTQRQVQEETQRIVSQWLKDNGQSISNRVNLDPRNTQVVTPQAKGLYNPKAMGAAIDKEFSGSADYFKTIWHNANNHDPENSAKLQRIRNAFSSTVPSEGGFLVPETLRSELLRVSLETSTVRPRARVIPMETSRVPFPAIDTTSNASSVYGGIVGYWTEEGAALAQSQASFGRIVLDAKKLTAYTEVPNELVSDSAVSFQAFMDEIFPEALGFYEDDAFLNGSGVGMPLGVLKGNGVVTVSQAVGTGSIVWADVAAMYSRMLPSSLNRAVWVASIDTFPQLAIMEISAGSPATWIPNGLSAGPAMTLLGRPVIFTEKVPGLGNAQALNFIDFGYYLIGDRQVMSATSSQHFRFQNDLTAYRIIERVDGRPWLESAITPKNGSANTLSPYVSLSAPL